MSVNARNIMALYIGLAGGLAFVTMGWLIAWQGVVFGAVAGLAGLVFVGLAATRSASSTPIEPAAQPQNSTPTPLKQGTGQHLASCLSCLQPGESWSGAVLDQLRLGLLIADGVGVIEYANQSWEALTSRSPAAHGPRPWARPCGPFCIPRTLPASAGTAAAWRKVKWPSSARRCACWTHAAGRCG